MADARAVKLMESIYTRVDKQVREIVTSMLPNVSVAAQDDGIVISNERRIVNFTGPGVVVADDPGRRRVNIFVPGSPADSATTTIASTAGSEKIYTLSSGSISGAPANWQTVGFSDSGWSNSVAMTVDVSAFYVVVPGATWTSDQAGSVSTPAGCLIRRSFTIPSGSAIVSAQLLVNVDDTFGPTNALYLNGVNIYSRLTGFHAGSPPGYGAVDLSPSDFLTGTNVLAAHIFNPAGAVGPHSISFKITITYASADTSSVRVREVDGSPTIATSILEVPNGSLTDMGSGVARFTPSSGSITVQEVDASPSIAATTIEFPNGTLSNPSGSVARYTPAVSGSRIWAQVRRTTDQSLTAHTSDVYDTVSFGTEDADTDGMVDLGTQPTRITIQTPGLYLIVGNTPIGTSASGGRATALAINGTIVRRFRAGPTLVEGYYDGVITHLADLSASDYIQLLAHTDQGGMSLIAGTYPSVLQAVKLSA